MSKSKVYFTEEITAESLVRIFDALNTELKGKTCVKLSTGEAGGHNFLDPKLIAPLVNKIDGTIARKMNLVTDFGKFLDPIADKLLVSSALICLTADGTLPAWITIVIIGREFIISAFRLVCADTGKTVAATWWGKSKTIAQMVTIIVLLMNIPQLAILETILIYVSLALTIISLVDYFVKNINVLKECSK